MEKQNTEEVREQIIKAQTKWAKGIIAIGKSNNPKETTNNMLNELYDFNANDKSGNPQILFKPTLAAEHPIRTTREETLSYFIGGEWDKTGFALKPWRHVVFNDYSLKIMEGSNQYIAMGTYMFYPVSGEPVSVDYTFGYRYGKKNELRIFLHHSSLSV